MNSVLTKRLNKKVFTVCFEGNIGSGKSSSLKYLSQKYDRVLTLSEPIDKWVDLKGYNLIDQLYKDLNRNAFGFEHYVQLTRLQMYGTPQSMDSLNPIRLMERSIYSQRYCFTENLIKSGNLSKPEALIIDEWFKWLTTKSCFATDLIIYLRTSPQTVYQRIKNRSRSEEMNIPLDYLKELHELHDKWLFGKERTSDGIKVITIDANVDQKQMYSLLDQNLENIFKEKLI